MFWKQESKIYKLGYIHVPTYFHTHTAIYVQKNTFVCIYKTLLALILLVWKKKTNEKYIYISKIIIKKLKVKRFYQEASV